MPIAPPYFLLLFLFSITMHARPCFYCMVLLTTMFMSTCYWPPIPVETPLVRPWSENVTTYADALRLMLPTLPDEKFPTTIPVADRCWCDLSHGFFAPFNTTKWEELSVTRAKESLEKEMAADERSREKERCEAAGGEQNEGSGTCEIPEDEPAVPEATPSPSLSFPESFIWRVAQRLRARARNMSATPSSTSPAEDPEPRREPSPSGHQLELHPSPKHAPNVTVSPEQSLVRMPWLRREYDLRRFGFAMVIDFAWPASHV
ncbi:hypothetical protein OH76DRAFT_1396627 [Lentinus brumalis]|uniref:Uncharacterized protein n=1 Tax=Lentinus brumalis TaxID=2498619 RepID=A0A371DUU7_9APHY|nr:hypothetical protein OH76DRAFT_1396627 [Polyporus brumalis]